jgi:PIN domain nuclease of toxin-antitoxin system
MSETFLLDTCVTLYLISNEPISDASNAAMNRSVDAGVPLLVSPITGWEVGLLAGKGRFRSSMSSQRWLEKLRAMPGIRFCELSAEILMASSFLPKFPYKDPADRIIAATAREHGYTVMTRDKALLDYGREGHLSVLEC